MEDQPTTQTHLSNAIKDRLKRHLAKIKDKEGLAACLASFRHELLKSITDLRTRAKAAPVISKGVQKPDQATCAKYCEEVPALISGLLPIYSSTAAGSLFRAISLLLFGVEDKCDDIFIAMSQFVNHYAQILEKDHPITFSKFITDLKIDMEISPFLFAMMSKVIDRDIVVYMLKVKKNAVIQYISNADPVDNPLFLLQYSSGKGKESIVRAAHPQMHFAIHVDICIFKAVANVMGSVCLSEQMPVSSVIAKLRAPLTSDSEKDELIPYLDAYIKMHKKELEGMQKDDESGWISKWDSLDIHGQIVRVIARAKTSALSHVIPINTKDTDNSLEASLSISLCGELKMTELLCVFAERALLRHTQVDMSNCKRLEFATFCQKISILTTLVERMIYVYYLPASSIKNENTETVHHDSANEPTCVAPNQVLRCVRFVPSNTCNSVIRLIYFQGLFFPIVGNASIDEGEEALGWTGYEPKDDRLNIYFLVCKGEGEPRTVTCQTKRRVEIGFKYSGSLTQYEIKTLILETFDPDNLPSHETPADDEQIAARIMATDHHQIMYHIRKARPDINGFIHKIGDHITKLGDSNDINEKGIQCTLKLYFLHPQLFEKILAYYADIDQSSLKMHCPTYDMLTESISGTKIINQHLSRCGKIGKYRVCKPTEEVNCIFTVVGMALVGVDGIGNIIRVACVYNLLKYFAHFQKAASGFRVNFNEKVGSLFGNSGSSACNELVYTIISDTISRNIILVTVSGTGRNASLTRIRYGTFDYNKQAILLLRRGPNIEFVHKVGICKEICILQQGAKDRLLSNTHNMQASAAINHDKELGHVVASTSVEQVCSIQKMPSTARNNDNEKVNWVGQINDDSQEQAAQNQTEINLNVSTNIGSNINVSRSRATESPQQQLESTILKGEPLSFANSQQKSTTALSTISPPSSAHYQQQDNSSFLLEPQQKMASETNEPSQSPGYDNETNFERFARTPSPILSNQPHSRSSWYVPSQHDNDNDATEAGTAKHAKKDHDMVGTQTNNIITPATMQEGSEEEIPDTVPTNTTSPNYVKTKSKPTSQYEGIGSKHAPTESEPRRMQTRSQTKLNKTNAPTTPQTEEIISGSITDKELEAKIETSRVKNKAELKSFEELLTNKRKSVRIQGRDKVMRKEDGIPMRNTKPRGESLSPKKAGPSSAARSSDESDLDYNPNKQPSSDSDSGDNMYAHSKKSYVSYLPRHIHSDKGRKCAYQLPVLPVDTLTYHFKNGMFHCCQFHEGSKTMCKMAYITQQGVISHQGLYSQSLNGCRVCRQAAFENLDELRIHLRQCLLSSVALFCVKCKIVFLDHDKREEHMEEKHNGGPPHK